MSAFLVNVQHSKGLSDGNPMENILSFYRESRWAVNACAFSCSLTFVTFKNASIYICACTT